MANYGHHSQVLATYASSIKQYGLNEWKIGKHLRNIRVELAVVEVDPPEPSTPTQLITQHLARDSRLRHRQLFKLL